MIIDTQLSNIHEKFITALTTRYDLLEDLIILNLNSLLMGRKNIMDAQGAVE
jgi:hypothetical protein